MNNLNPKVNIINNSGEPIKIKIERATKAPKGFAMINIFKKKQKVDSQQIIIDTVMRAIETNKDGIRDLIQSLSK